MSKGPRHSHRVYKYLEDHMGTNTYIDDIAKDVGVTAEQARKSISYLRNRGVEVETIQTGYIYRLHPKSPKEELGTRIFEEVGKTISGTIIVRCENGILYKLVELEM